MFIEKERELLISYPIERGREREDDDDDEMDFSDFSHLLYS